MPAVRSSHAYHIQDQHLLSRLALSHFPTTVRMWHSHSPVKHCRLQRAPKDERYGFNRTNRHWTFSNYAACSRYGIRTYSNLDGINGQIPIHTSGRNIKKCPTGSASCLLIRYRQRGTSSRLSYCTAMFTYCLRTYDAR